MKQANGCLQDNKKEQHPSMFEYLSKIKIDAYDIRSHAKTDFFSSNIGSARKNERENMNVETGKYFKF